MSTTKGFFLNNLVEIVKEHAQDAGVHKLRELFGEPLEFRSYRDYPEEQEAKLIDAACKTLFPNTYEEGQYRIGQMVIQKLLSSVYGKTLMSIFGHDPMTVALNVPKAFAAVTSGVQITATKVDECTVHVEVYNVPFHIEYYRGLFDGAIQSLGYEIQGSAEVKGKGHYFFQGNWKKK